VCIQVAFLQKDEAGMGRQLLWARGNPEAGELLNDSALIALYRGKMKEAQQLFSQAIQVAQRKNFVETATDIQARKAVFEADFGHTREAREDALATLPAATGNATEQAFAALSLARAGDENQAAVEARSSAALAPLDTILTSAILASYRAAVSSQKHDHAGAIQALEEARPFEHCDSMKLAPAYYRGPAYLQNHQPELAARKFEKLIKHRALADCPLYVVLSHLYLGRSYDLLGNARKATDAFKEVDRIWKDADPHLPALILL
jgi:tetratricopeptide (TPR) repeat protein